MTDAAAPPVGDDAPRSPFASVAQGAGVGAEHLAALHARVSGLLTRSAEALAKQGVYAVTIVHGPCEQDDERRDVYRVLPHAAHGHFASSGTGDSSTYLFDGTDGPRAAAALTERAIELARTWWRVSPTPAPVPEQQDDPAPLALWQRLLTAATATVTLYPYLGYDPAGYRRVLRQQAAKTGRAIKITPVPGYWPERLEITLAAPRPGASARTVRRPR